MPAKKQEKKPHVATGRPRGRPRKDGTPPQTKTPEQKEQEALIKAERAQKREIAKKEFLEGEPSENQKLLRSALDGWSAKPINLDNFDEVSKRARTYFRDCIENDTVPTMIGDCRRLGITKMTLWNWRAGKQRDSRYQRLAEDIAGIVEESLVALSLENKVNNIAAIVQLKNHFGYTDEQKIVVEPKQSFIDDTMTMEDVLAIAESPQPRIAQYSELNDMEENDNEE